jgi:hypothetical protein
VMCLNVHLTFLLFFSEYARLFRLALPYFNTRARFFPNAYNKQISIIKKSNLKRLIQFFLETLSN